jgi:hypothetical protein
LAETRRSEQRLSRTPLADELPEIYAWVLDVLQAEAARERFWDSFPGRTGLAALNGSRFGIPRMVGRETKVMDYSDIEIGQKYKCDYQGDQYFGSVREKKDGRIGVMLADRVGEDGDPGDPIDRLGTRGVVWVSPECIHRMLAGFQI